MKGKGSQGVFRHRVFLMFVFCRVRYTTLPDVAVAEALFGERDQGQPRDLDCIALYCVVLHVRLISPPVSLTLSSSFRESTSVKRKRAILGGGGQGSLDAAEGKRRRVD